MTPKFNFLARRTVAAKAVADLRRQFPHRSTTWISEVAARVSGNDDVTTELRAPEREAIKQSGKK